MITYPDKISPIIFCPENRFSGKMNYGAASIRIRINKEVTRKKKLIYMPQSACLARIGGRLLIEIDFGTGPVSSGAGAGGGGRDSEGKRQA